METEKDRYELKKVATGAFAYVLKESMANGQPPHWICTQCYQNRKKSFLQIATTAPERKVFYKCSVCSSTILLPWSVSPGGSDG